MRSDRVFEKMHKITPNNRLEGLDLARYVAFVGMVIVNFKIVMGAEGGTGVLGVLSGALEGRAAATFVVLAGIGLGLAGRGAFEQTLWVTVKRALFLLVIGLVNMTVFEADILHYYAFYFLFGVLLLPLGSRALLAIILALNLIFAVMIVALDYDVGWDWKTYSYAGFWTPAGFVRNLFFNGWHPVIPWLGFLLFGVVLGRLVLARRATQGMLILGGVVALAMAEFSSVGLTALLVPYDAQLALLVSTKPVPPMALYMLAGMGGASIVVGLCLMLAGPLARIGVLDVLAPAGRQTLTLYLAHILVGMGVLEALGMIGGQSIAQAVVASAIFCGFVTIYAFFWARKFRRGPVEALMRRLAG